MVTLLMAVAGSLLWDRYGANPEPDDNTEEEAQAELVAPEPPVTSTVAPPAPSVAAYQAIAPSLVWITTADGPAPAAADDADGQEVPSGGLGTGFIADAQGSIVTANHVVAGAESIEVIFADGTRAQAVVENVFPERDIAVLSADASPSVIVPAVLGGGVRVGDEVYAVGNPLGLASSMSAGIVSGLGREIPVSEENDVALEGLIQFDAAVNPGNSGGPLLDRNGRVVGVVTALANPSDQNFFVGIGFAATLPGGGGGDGGGIAADV